MGKELFIATQTLKDFIGEGDFKMEKNMSKVNEMKTRYNDSAYIEDFGDYKIVKVDKRDSDWLIEQAEEAEELREENKRLKEEIENIRAEHEFQLNTRDE